MARPDGVLRLGAGSRISGTGICPYFATLSYVFPSQRLITESVASHSLAAYSATTSSTGCKSLGELAITPKISLVPDCCSAASASSRSRDSSCSVRRRTSFLSWLSSVARGLFFFFEAPTLAMRVLLTPNLEDFQRLTVREADQKTPWSESLLDNEVECQPAAEILSFPLSISSNANRI